LARIRPSIPIQFRTHHKYNSGSARAGFVYLT
jgi:hypothetical protein